MFYEIRSNLPFPYLKKQHTTTSHLCTCMFWMKSMNHECIDQLLSFTFFVTCTCTPAAFYANELQYILYGIEIYANSNNVMFF